MSNDIQYESLSEKVERLEEALCSVVAVCGVNASPPTNRLDSVKRLLDNALCGHSVSWEGTGVAVSRRPFECVGEESLEPSEESSESSEDANIRSALSLIARGVHPRHGHCDLSMIFQNIAKAVFAGYQVRVAADGELLIRLPVVEEPLPLGVTNKF